MSTPKSFLAFATAAVLLAGCAADPASPDAASGLAPRSAAFLLGPDEGFRILSDTTDAFGNEVMVAEYAAGVYAGTPRISVASVTIRMSIPASNGSGSCITSTVQGVETTTGWTSSIKKSGGCDKSIEVLLENRGTKQKATFSFLNEFGKTRIDSGLIR